MLKNKTLFDRLPLARDRDAITSHAAADRLKSSGNDRSQAAAVLLALSVFGPQTAAKLGEDLELLVKGKIPDHEAAKRREWPHKRAAVLENKGYITREIVAGYDGKVITITDVGIEWLKNFKGD